LLIAWSGNAAAGFWGLGLRYLKAPATLVGTAVSQALYPKLAQAGPAEAQRAVREVMAILGAMACVLMVVLLVAGPWLFERVFGASWRVAGELARALAPYIAAHFVAAPLAVVTMAWKAQRWAFWLSVVGQIVFLDCLAGGLWMGGAEHGLLCGAWAVSAGMVVYFGYYFWRLARWKAIPAPAASMESGAAS
jgi:O-antigen/teichoic acid export membrane protein